MWMSLKWWWLRFRWAMGWGSKVVLRHGEDWECHVFPFCSVEVGFKRGKLTEVSVWGLPDGRYLEIYLDKPHMLVTDLKVHEQTGEFGDFGPLYVNDLRAQTPSNGKSGP